MSGLLYVDVKAGDRLPGLSFDITTTGVIAGALASRDYSPLHHDFHYVTEQAGHRDILLNTPHQAAFFERLLGDWAGPRGRLGRMRFRMQAPVYTGDRIQVSGEVIERAIDEHGCAWVTLALAIAVGAETATECEARYALPLSNEDNPWLRQGEEWQP